MIRCIEFLNGNHPSSARSGRKQDAQYYIGCMQHAIDWLKQEARFASEQDRESSITAFEQGKAVYEQRAREARR